MPSRPLTHPARSIPVGHHPPHAVSQRPDISAGKGITSLSLNYQVRKTTTGVGNNRR